VARGSDRAPLTRRGHFRIDPLAIRTGDPFGFFEASAAVGQGVSVVVYPRLEPVPAWKLPAAAMSFFHRRSHWADWTASHQVGLASARQVSLNSSG